MWLINILIFKKNKYKFIFFYQFFQKYEKKSEFYLLGKTPDPSIEESTLYFFYSKKIQNRFLLFSKKFEFPLVLRTFYIKQSYKKSCKKKKFFCNLFMKMFDCLNFFACHLSVCQFCEQTD